MLFASVYDCLLLMSGYWDKFYRTVQIWSLNYACKLIYTIMKMKEINI